MNSTLSRSLILGLTMLSLWASSANGATVCTLVTNLKTGEMLQRSGQCAQRVTPASTFKLALSLMGFDAGFLQDEHQPTLNYQPGDPDWGGAAWLAPTNPTRWIQYSVVWYSQRVTHALGAASVQRYTDAFEYGNADLSGDPGKHNGLDRAWIGSSLKISPLEQMKFVQRLVNRELPVSPHAIDVTERISLLEQRPDDWELHGKTGTAFPRDVNGVADESHGTGWFVGWARKGERVVGIVRLVQDQQAHPLSAGVRARDSVLNEWNALLAPPEK